MRALLHKVMRLKTRQVLPSPACNTVGARQDLRSGEALRVALILGMDIRCGFSMLCSSAVVRWRQVSSVDMLAFFLLRWGCCVWAESHPSSYAWFR